MRYYLLQPLTLLMKKIINRDDVSEIHFRRWEPQFSNKFIQVSIEETAEWVAEISMIKGGYKFG
jgi:hypothetical protein